MAKHPSRFLALLRGINVGGRNLLKKDDLRRCFEDLGFTAVRTYIQSGNIVFRSHETSIRELTKAIEAGLSERFKYQAQAVVLNYRKYQALLEAAPIGWGQDDQQKHNAIFTLDGTTPSEVLEQLPPPKAEIESIQTGPGVIFWSASKKQLTRTTMMKLAAAPVYQQVTVRNHNTVFKLLQILESI